MSSVRDLAMAVITGSMLLASPALAHPKLLSSTPAANASIDAPSRITLTFSERLMAKLSGIDIVMTGMPGMPSHRSAVMGLQISTDAEGKTLIVALSRPLPPGTYQVTWHAVSADTHRIQGNFAFAVK